MGDSTAGLRTKDKLTFKKHSGRNDKDVEWLLEMLKRPEVRKAVVDIITENYKFSVGIRNLV